MRRSSARLLKAAADNSGAVAVEFALVSTAFLTLILGTAYIGMMMFNDASLRWALEKGSRLAAINKTATQSQIAAEINGYLSSAGLPSATVNYSATSAGGVAGVSITASFARSYTIPFVSTFNITHSSSTYVPQGG